MATAAQIGEQLRRSVEKQAIRLVLDLVSALMRATPVDTGHARRNWWASIGRPVTEETIAGGGASTAQVTSYRLEMGAMFVSNPVPYVWFLNYGTSKQAAAGWIETTVYAVLQRARERGGSLDVAGIQSAFLDLGGESGAQGLASSYSPFGED